MKNFLLDSVAITGKELKQLRRDPVSLILTVMFPIILIGMFIVVAATFSATYHNVPVVVADEDQTPASNELITQLLTSSDIHVIQVIEEGTGGGKEEIQQAYQMVENGQVIGAIVIPQGFGADLAQGDAYVIVSTDNSKVTSSTYVVGAVNSAAQAIITQATGEGVPKVYVNETEGGVAFLLKLAPIHLIVMPLSGRPTDTGDPILPGFLGMVTILGAFDDTVNAISRERERGTFPRLSLSPVSMLAVYSGKISATVVLTILRTTLMLIIFKLYGLVIRGNLMLIYLTTILIGIFTLSLGLAISSRIRGSATLTVLEIAMTFPLFSLAGTFRSPLLLAPAGRAIAYSLPWSYGNDALRRLIFLGAGFNAVASDLAILFVSSLILLPIAILLSKRTM